jgi:hypothetical protein
VIKRDSVRLSQPYPGNAVQSLAMEGLATTFQGKRIAITGFAVDQAGRTGYAVRPTQVNPEGNLANAWVDSTLVVYGRTYKLPRLGGSVGDIAIDRGHGNVLLSNTAFKPARGLAERAEEVRQPRRRRRLAAVGLFVSNNPDTLLVANSGGTNISRVFIGSTDARAIREDSLHRIPHPRYVRLRGKRDARREDQQGDHQRRSADHLLGPSAVHRTDPVG